MYEKRESRQYDLPTPAEGMPRQLFRIAIKAHGKFLFIDPSAVVTVEARGNNVLFRQLSGTELLRESISSVAEKLLPYGLVRIHRSVLANSSLIEGIQPRTMGGYTVRIKGGREFHVSRTYKKNLQSITPVWLGTDIFQVN